MSKRILVVDDDETILEIVAAMLATSGYECRTAGSGVEALGVLETEEFDLLLTNLMMAEMDGIALMERTLQKYPNMPVVFETAVHDMQVALQVLLAGASDYVLKPFTRERLLCAIEHAICAIEHAIEKPRVKGAYDNYHPDLDVLIEHQKRTLIDLEASCESTIQVLADALDRVAAGPEGNSMRVTAYTIALAERMGMWKEKIRVVARGAYLRDIGKLSVPDHILRKPGKLSPDEVNSMERHCYFGYQMIRGIPFLANVAEIVYCHHERYDGSGFPRGLRGAEIPLGARLVALAETLVWITSNRGGQAGSFNAAREEIGRLSGLQFDPQVVETFLSMPDALWEGLHGDAGAPM